jgi:hypothetical protein
MRQSEKIQWNQALSDLLRECLQKKLIHNQALAGGTETAL